MMWIEHAPLLSENEKQYRFSTNGIKESTDDTVKIQENIGVELPYRAGWEYAGTCPRRRFF
jgi:hypothetical protein